MVGHTGNLEAGIKAIEVIDEQLGRVYREIENQKGFMIIVSDHGNIEDLSTKSHTRNPVPLILIGKNRQQLAARINKLEHTTPALVELITHRR